MTSPIQPDKTYGVLHIESFFSFLGFAKKIGSNETQKIDVYLDDKLIDTIEANKFIEKIDDMYDVENQAFSYNLPTEYIGKKATISFKNHDSQDELLNSPYTLIDKNHESFNEARFIHSLNEPISEDLKNMYKSNSIGFLATKENLEDDEFVEYINQIMNDFPAYKFVALYIDKNLTKEIKNKFGNNSLELIELKDKKDIFANLEVYLSNYQKNLQSRIENSIIYYLINNATNIIGIGLLLNFNMTLKKFEEDNQIYFGKLLNSLDLLGFDNDDIKKYGSSFYEIYFKKNSERYNINIDFDINETMKKGYVYYNLKLGQNNHDFFAYAIDNQKKRDSLQSKS
ncbi:hypothetical protein [Aliarcobacter butzleri]|uniref:hypothetical protein n=1 Tax=Aliarcobacter butzleri TaxID=28197 RepID=UPI000DB7E4BF|nr:hypothetical protein [Aliarcobacter butzleri]MDN5062013.1 hypothetical protein [Aliarcobacter butzleri]PZQ05895.1 MAG: hypothetical protein DI567_08300 [Aliarcobacter butzleri]